MDKRTKLLYAILNGNIWKVSELFQSLDPVTLKEWLESESYRLVCHVTERKGSEMAKVLLENGSKVNDTETGRNRNTPLHTAASSGDLGLVETLLARGAKLEERNRYGLTPLHLAVRNERMEVVQLLLECKVDVDSVDARGRSAIQFSVESGNEALTELLLQKGANANAEVCNGFETDRRFRDGMMELRVRELPGHENLAAILLSYKTGVISIDSEDRTPIYSSVRNGRKWMTKLFLETGAPVNEMSCNSEAGLSETRNGSAINKMTLLHFAARKGHESILKLLLHYNADVNSTDQWGRTPIFFPGSVPIAEFLLDNGSHVNAKAKDGTTALHVAAQGIVDGTLELLLKRGADANCRDNNGVTPLHVASRSGYPHCIEMLLKWKVDVNAKDKLGKSPLHVASRSGYPHCVEMLLKWKVDVNAKDKLGTSALHVAAERSKGEIFELLLKHGADANCRDDNGETPLHVATRNANVSVVEILLEREVDVNAKAMNVKSALQVAAKVIEDEILELLLKHDADTNGRDDNGETPIHVATRSMYADGVELLLELKVDVNAKAKNGNTALHVAAEGTKIEILERLLKHGADKNCRNLKGETPLHVATRNGYPGHVATLVEWNADVNATDENGCTSLHLLGLKEYEDFTSHLINENVYIANLLIKADAGLDYKCKDGLTPLHMAAMSGNVIYVEILLENGADLNALCDSGPTPFAMAAHAMLTGDGGFLQIECFSKFAIKMRASGLYVREQNLKLLGITIGFCDECEIEIKAMKGRKIKDSDISFFDILTKNLGRVVRYLRNENVRTTLAGRYFALIFPIYGDQIDKKFGKANERYNLLQERAGFFKRGEFKKLPDCCIEKICDYLSNRDLKKLIDLTNAVD